MSEKEKYIFYKNIIKQLPVAIAIFDKNLNYIFASDRWAQETNLNIPEIIGKNIYEVVPDIPKKWREIHQRALKGEHLMAAEDVFNRQDGSQEWWRWRVLPWYSLKKEISGITLFVEKITERKQIEIKMKKMINALNQSNAELERFAHICAHDLNEPLRTIANYGQLLEKDFINKMGPIPKKYISNIMKSIKHAEALINGILAYSQLDTIGLQKTVVSLNNVVDSLIVILDQKIKEKKAFIYFDTLPKVYGDKMLISTVLQNIINNAIKFNTSEIPIVRISCKVNKKFFLFCIEDNGIGIEPAYQKSIFELFRRLHRNTEYEGTGLGLSITKKIITAHGGQIWVKSTANKGSQFFFTLPKLNLNK